MTDLSNELESYCKTLCLGVPDTSTVEDILTFLIELDYENIYYNKEIIAKLYCKIATLFKIDIFNNHETIKEIFCNTFKTIKSAYIIVTKNSSLYEIILNFLVKLNQIDDLIIKDKNYIITPEINNQFSEICNELEDISEIFNFYIDDHLCFPIANLLSLILVENKFNIERLDITTLNTLLLALEIFKTISVEETEKIKFMIKENNLICLNYLASKNVKKMGDTYWKQNFIKNGFLVLINQDEHKIYIRNTKKSYFNNDEVQMEFNSKKQIMAYFIEKEYDDEDNFLSVDDIFVNGALEEKIELLKLIYDKKNYNLFWGKSIIKTKSNLIPINPYTQNDGFIILKEKILPINIESLNIAFSPFYLTTLWDYNNFDYVLLGTIVKLLSISNKITITEIDNKMTLTKSNNLQNILFNNCFAKLDYNEISNFIEIYFNNINYVAKNKLFIKQDFKNICFLPLKLDTNFIVSGLERTYPNYIKNITNKGFSTIIVEYNRNAEPVKYYLKNTDISFEEIDKIKIRLLDDTILENKEYLAIEQDEYFYVSSNIDKYLRLYKKIQEKNFAIPSSGEILTFPHVDIDEILDKMKLQKEALTNLNDISANFNIIARLRLFHHCLYNDITSRKKWSTFFELINKHENISFKDSKSYFPEKKDGILFVPKDNINSDAVLYSIANKYLNSPSERNFDIYNYELTYRKDKYLINNIPITQIIFVFDNIQRGSATIKTLHYYIDDVKTYKNGKQKYYCNSEEVTVKEIIDNNNITDLKILALYCSDEGKENVLYEFKEKNLEFLTDPIPINYSVTQDFLNKVNEIYKYDDESYKLNVGDYPIIREFNQPKKNIFPSELLNPNNLPSIFVKKDELHY